MRQHEAELKIVERIKAHEGGLNEKEPAHVGGVSYKGITQQAFEEWAEGDGAEKAKGITSLDNSSIIPMSSMRSITTISKMRGICQTACNTCTATFTPTPRAKPPKLYKN